MKIKYPLIVTEITYKPATGIFYDDWTLVLSNPLVRDSSSITLKYSTKPPFDVGDTFEVDIHLTPLEINAVLD